MMGTLAERFWGKVAFLGAGPDDCWEWRAAKDSYGYGEISKGAHGSGILRAHRVSWELTNGPIPKGMCILHHCDNPACVNPAHLFLGTIEDNNHDMASKGRSTRGEKSSNARLTEQDVYEIRRMLNRGILQRVVAKKYGVSQRAISDIKTGETWNWLKEVAE